MNVFESLRRLPRPSPPTIWGPHYWRILHACVDRYKHTGHYGSRKYSAAVVWLFRNIQSILPCEECSSHTFEFLRPFLTDISRAVTEDREYPSRLMWALHNYANNNLGKPIYSYENLEGPTTVLEWVESMWVVALTQSTLLKGKGLAHAATFVELFDGLMPFLAPNESLEFALGQFAFAHRDKIHDLVSNFALGKDHDGLMVYLENLRQCLVQAAKLW